MKRRQGFVSNSSSSSFVLFGVQIEDDKVAQIAWAKIKAELTEKYGSLDAVPTTERSWSKEGMYHEIVNHEDGIEAALEDVCKYELGEAAGITYADEYCGYWLGENPTWFRNNPDKTYNDLKAQITEMVRAAGVEGDIEIEYIETEIQC